jgi:hypothetical protein
MRDLACRRLAPEAVHNSSLRQIVGRKLHLDPIALQDADVVLPNFARDVGQDLIAIFQLYCKVPPLSALTTLPITSIFRLLGLTVFCAINPPRVNSTVTLILCKIPHVLFR